MTTNSIIFIDSTVTDYKTLASQAKAGTEVIVLDNSKDGVSQITEALAGRSDLASIQIISHGGEGMVQLGSTILSNGSLEEYTSQLQQWGNTLADNGDILFYGCNVATGDGKAFVEQLSEITGADVAASNDLTGNAALGGDWDLEVVTGEIEATQGISQTATDNYGDILAVYKVSTNSDSTSTGSLRWAIEKAKSNTDEMDVIDLRGISGDIDLSKSLPTIDKGGDLFFIGNGNVNFDADSKYQIIAIDTDSVVGFQGVNFEEGYAKGGDGKNGGGGGLGAGGAIFVNKGKLVVDNSSFLDNEAKGGSSLGRAGNGFRGDGNDGSGGSGGDGGKLNVTGDSFFSSNQFIPFSSNQFTPGSGGSGRNGSGSRGTNGAFGTGGGAGGGGGDKGEAYGGDGGDGGFGAGGGGGGGGGYDENFFDDDWGQGGDGGDGGPDGTDIGGDGAGGSAGNGNRQGGRGGGGAGLGGAIFARENATLNVTNSKFSSNSVTGGSGANSGRARGEAIAKQFNTTTRDYNNSNKVNIISLPSQELSDNSTFPLISIKEISNLESNGKITLSSNTNVDADLDIYYFITPKSGNVTTDDFVNNPFSGVFKFKKDNKTKDNKTQDFDLIKNDIIAENLKESFEIQLLPGTNYRLQGLDKGINENSAIKETVTIEDDEPNIGIQKIIDKEDILENGGNAEFELIFDRERTKDFTLNVKVDAVSKKDSSDINKYFKETGNKTIRGSHIDTAKGADYLFYWRYDEENAQKKYIDGSEFTVKANTGITKKIIVGVEAIDDDVAEQAESVTVELVEQISGDDKLFYGVDSNNKSATVNIKDNEPILEFLGVKNAKEYDTLLPDGADSDTIGYVELKADRAIKNSIGLWVKYTITAGNNVIEGVDYLSSQYRKVSFQASSQDKGIIIPTGEGLSSNNEGDADKIRIYFAALPDAIKENNEDIKIEIQPYHFDLDSTGNQQISNYFLKQNNNIVDKITTSIKVEDSGLYSNQVLIFDSVGQLISQRNPLTLTDDKTTFQVKLGSEPLENVTVNFIPPQPQSDGSLEKKKTTKKEGTEANDQLNQAIPIKSTEFVFNGEISNNKDIDTFEVNLKAGDKIKIDVDARAIKLSQVDSQINLLNSQGEVISKNDDNSGDNYDPLVEYKIAEDGIYYIQVVYSQYYGSSRIKNSSGKYQLKVDVTPVETKPAKSVTFTRENWDKLQTVSVEEVYSKSNLKVETSSNDSNYRNLNLNLPVTITPPPQVVVKEGGSKQEGTPLVSVFAVGEANTKELVLRESNLEPGKFIIQLNRAAENDVKIKYTLSGSAELKSDYSGNFEKDSQNTNSYIVTIPKGETSVTLSVDPEADDIEEQRETIIVTLNQADGYGIDSNDKSKTINLIDSNRVGFQLGNVSLDGNITPTFRSLQTTEGGDSDTFAIRLRSQPKSDVTVNFSGLNSKENSIATAKVTFTPQNWNQYQSVKVTGIADNKVDDNVTYELQAKATSDDKDYHEQTIPVTVTNQNIDEKVESVNSTRPDPTLPMVTLEGTNTTFTENADDSAKVKVILDRPAPKDGLTVFLSLDRSTATWQQDFNINTNLFLNQSGTSNPFNTVKVDEKKVGNYSYPAFADLDGDSDLDLVVGHSKGTLKFYRNVGTEFIPLFREEVGTSNPFGSINIGNVKDGYSTPTFADIIDGDGKLDLVVGSADGTLFYSQNISDSKGIKFAPIKSLEINTINGVDGNKTFENSTPTFVDLDGDGDLDAVVGDADGTIRYFKNTRKNKTQTNIIEPILTALTGNNNPFNNIDVGDNSTPNLVDFDGDGDLDLFVGNKAGKISFYRNNGTATTPQFNLDTNIPTNNWSNGNNAALQFVDIDGDNDLDGVIGAADGTLQYQQQYQAIIIPEGQTEAEIQLKTIDDKFKEDEEIVNLKLVDNAKYRINTNQQENYFKTIKIQDDEKAGLLIKDAQGNRLSILQFSTQENNQTPLKFFLELTSKPTAPVEVSLYTTDENEGKLRKSDSPANTIALTFTQNNWNQPQEFTVVPQNDAVEDGTVAYGITYQVSSQDVAYNDTVDYKTVTTGANTQNGNSSSNRLLNITNQDDNDKAGFIITPLSIGKEGTQDAFSIKLNSQPKGDVVVTLTPQDRDFYFVTQKPGENFTVTFNAQNWNKEQTLQIQAVDDAEVEYLQRSAIAFQVSGEDDNYNKAGAELKPVHVIIQDDDKPTARIKAGKSASEVYSTPGYFVVELDRDLLQQGSLVLDGEDDYVTVPKLEIGGDFALEAWVNVEDGSKNGKIFDAGNGSSDGLTLEFVNNKLRFGYYNGQEWKYLTTTDSVAEKQWVHVAVSVDDKNNGTIYVNGESKGNASNLNIPEKLRSQIAIGSQFDGKQEFFKGKITEVRVWNQARNSDQIRQNMNRFLTGLEDGLKAYYSVSNNNPTNLNPEILIDYTNNGIDAKLNNGAVWKVEKFDAPIYALPPGNTGLEVNYQIKGGSAQKDADYQSIGTDKDGKGKVRVFGNQILIPVVPIDDKKIEDISFKVNGNPVRNSNNLTLNIEGKALSSTDGESSSQKISLSQGSIINFGNDIFGKIIKDATLSSSFDGNSINYSGQIEVEINSGDANQINNNSTGRITSETVEVTLLAGDGYRLADNDANSQTASIDIIDNDVPGVRIVKGGNRIVAIEDDVFKTSDNDTIRTSEFEISLLSEPSQDVTITLTTNDIKKNNREDKEQLKFVDKDGKLVNEIKVTFKPEDWFKLQSIKVQALDDGIIEPDLDKNVAVIDYKIDSEDVNYKGLTLDSEKIYITDRVLDKSQTIQGIDTGFGTLQDSVDNLELPIIGSLKGRSPSLIQDLGSAVSKAVTQTEPDKLTANSLDKILEESLNDLGISGVDVTTIMTDTDVSFEFNAKKEYNLFKLDLSTDLGLPALGIGFDTEGQLTGDFKYNFSLGFGLNKLIGFYINPDKTKFHADISLNLSDDFKGKGNLGFLQLDFANDKDNPTKLEISADISIKDLEANKEKTVEEPVVKTIDVTAEEVKSTPSDDLVIPEPKELKPAPTEKIAPKPQAKNISALTKPLTKATPSEKTKQIPTENPVLAKTIGTKTVDYQRNLQTITPNGTFTSKEKDVTTSNLVEWLKGSETTTDIPQQVIDTLTKASPEVKIALQTLLAETTGVNFAFNDKQIQISYPDEVDIAKLALVIPGIKDIPLKGLSLPVTGAELTITNPGLENADYTFKAASLPKTELVNWLKNQAKDLLPESVKDVLNKLLELGNNVDFLLADNQLQVTYLGDIDLAKIKDIIPGIKDLPLTGLSLPVKNPSITITNPGSISANYAVTADSLPKSKLVSWLKNQDKSILPETVQDVLNQLLSLTDNLDIALGKEQIQIAYQGNLNLTQFNNVIPGIKNLPLDGLELPVTNPLITITNPGSVNADYSFVAEKLPKAQLVSWLTDKAKSVLPQSVQDVVNELLKLTENVDFILADNQIEIGYEGNLDLAKLVSLIPGVKELVTKLPLDGLSLPVINPRLTINNPKGNNPDFAFAADSLPTKEVSQWLLNKTQSLLPESTKTILNQLFVQGFEQVDLVLGSEQIEIGYQGDLALDKLILLIPGLQDLPLEGLNLPITNPKLTLLNLSSNNVDYAFDFERLPKDELITWVKEKAVKLFPTEVSKVLEGLFELTENIDLQLGKNQIQIAYDGDLELSGILKQVPGLSELSLDTLKLPVTNPRFTIVNPTTQDIDYSFAVDELPKQQLIDWLKAQLPSQVQPIVNAISDIAQQVDILFSDKQLQLAYQGNLDLVKVAKEIPGIKDLSLDGLALPITNPQLTLSNLGTSDFSYAFKSDRLPKKELVNWLTNTVVKLLPEDTKSFVNKLLAEVENINLEIADNQIQIGYVGDLNLKNIIDGITSKLGDFLLPLKGLNLTLTNPSFTITNPNANPSFNFNVDSLPVNDIKTWLIDRVKTLVEDESVQNLLTGLLEELSNIDLVLGDNQTQITYNGSIDLIKALKAIPGLDDFTPDNLNLPVLNPSFTIAKTGNERSYSLTAERLPKDELTKWLSEEVTQQLPDSVSGLVKSLLAVGERIDATLGDNQIGLSYEGNLDLATIITEIPGLKELTDKDLKLPVLNPSLQITNPGKNANYSFKADKLPKQELVNWLVKQLPSDIKSLVNEIAKEAQNLDVLLSNDLIEIAYNGNLDLVKLVSLIPGVKDLLSDVAEGLKLPVLNPSITIFNPGKNATFSIDAEKLPKKELVDWLSSKLPSDIATVLNKLSNNLDINIAENQLQLEYNGDIDLLELAELIPGVKDLPLDGLKLDVTNPSFTLLNPGKDNADYIFNAERLPTTELLNWVKKTANNKLPDSIKPIFNKLLELGSHVNFVLGESQIQIAFDGDLDLAKVIKLIPGVQDIKALSGLNLPVTNPSVTIVNFGQEAKTEYLLKSDRLPKEELIIWAKEKATELLPPDLVKVFNSLMNIAEGIDLEVGNNQIEIAYNGSIDLANIIKEIPGLNELPLNNLNLPVLNPSLTITNPGKSANYSFAAEKLPKQELINWLKVQAQELIPNELQGIFNVLADIGEQLDIQFGDSKFEVKYQGNLNLVNILKEIPGLSSFDFTGLTLDVKNPSITIANPGKNADFSFTAEKLPIAQLQTWLINKAGDTLPKEAKDILNGLKDLAQDIDILLTDNQVQVLYDGTIDVVNLIKEIPGISNIPLPPANALTVTKPALTITRTTKEGTSEKTTDFNFTAEKLNKEGLKKWLIDQTTNAFPESVKKVVTTLIDTAADFEVLFANNQLQISYPGTLDLANVIKEIPGLAELTKGLQLPITNPILKIYDLDKGISKAQYTFAADSLPKDELVSWLTTQAKENLPGDLLNAVEEILELARRVDLQIGDRQIDITYDGVLDLSDALEKIPGLDKLNVNTLDLPLTNPSLTIAKPKDSSSWSDAEFSFNADKLPTKELTDWLVKQAAELIPASVVTPVKNIIDAFGTVDITVGDDLFHITSDKIDFAQVIKAIPGINTVFTTPPELTLNKPSLSLTDFSSGTTKYQFSASKIDLSKLGTSLGIPDALNKALPTVDLFISNDKLKLTAPQGIDLKSLVPIEQLGLPEVISKYIPEIKIDNPQISVTKAENSSKNIDLSGTVAGLNLGLNYSNGKWTSKGIDDGGRLSVLDLITAFKTSKDNKQNFYKYIDYQLKGEANLGLTAKTSVNGNPVFPSFNFDLAANFPIFNYGNKEEADKKGADIQLNNVGIDLGSFISDLIGPVLKEVNKIIEPVKPVIKLLNSDTKLFTELGIADAFDNNNDKKVTIFEVAKLLVPEEEKEKLEKSERFIKAVGDIVDTIALLSQIPADQSIIIDLGSFSLTDFKAGSKDKDKTADKLNTNSVETTKTIADPFKDAIDTVNKQTDTATNSTDKTKATNNKSTGSFLSKINSIEGLEFPILTSPMKAIDLLLGKTTDLIVYDIPDLDFKFDIESGFPVYGPVPIIKGVLGGSFEAKTDLSIGFDTAGINQWKNDDFQLSSIYKVFDGFYLSDWDKNGKDVNELTLKATIEAGLGVSVLLASASLRGGIEGIVGLDVVDVGENTGKSDGKIRGSEIISRIKRPWELFKLNGNVDVFLKGEAKAFFKTVWEKEFARFNLAKFTLSADGFTFSSKLSQSYIAGATIFLDTNFNNQWDEGEIKTVSNEYGKFDLEIPLEVDLNGDGEIGTDEAQLVGLGGFDTSSGLPSGALIALPDSEIVTPLTSLQARLVQSGLTADAANTLIKDKLSLDLTASLETFDPLKSVGEDDPLQAINQDNDDGLNIYLAHIQVQALLNHSQALLDGLQTNPNNLLIAIDGLARFLQISTDAAKFDVTNQESVKTFFSFLLEQEQLTLTPEQLQTAAQITAKGNQFLSKVKKIGASKSVKDALPVLASVKRVVQGTLSNYLQQLASAEQSAENIFAEVEDALNQNYYLVDANGNAFGNRYVYVEAIIPEVTSENTDFLNENDTTFEFKVELTQPAPNQGLTVIYSLSGTATLGKDYEVETSKLGELYIKPGETTGTIKVKLLNDDSSESRETIALNLQSVGEGYTIDPIGKVALVDIEDENAENNSVEGKDIIGRLGKDTLVGTAGDDFIEGYFGSDKLYGLKGDDSILGGSGEDTVYGGSGDDYLEGNFGKDILNGEEGNDFIDGTSGDDELIGGSGVDILLGAADNDQLEGNTGNDQLEGEAGNDYLEGNEDNDWLSGGTGNDILIGGAGDDIKYGGDGADVFFFESTEDGFDTILDFNPSEGDKIQVSGTNFGIKNLDKFRFINGVLDFNGKNLALIQNDGATYAYFTDLNEIIQIVEQPEHLTDTSSSDNSKPATPDNSIANISIDNPQSTILDEIIKRGRIKFATSSAGSEFDFEFVRSLAVALFGDASKVEKVDTTFSKAFELVANGTVDIASQRSTHRLGRDTKLGIDFSPTYFYDYQAVVVKEDTGIEDVTDLKGRTIGVVSNGLNNLQNLFNPYSIEFTPKLFGSLDELFAAYENQEIDAISTDHYLIAERLKRQNDFENHRFFDVEFSREPIALALPENDSQWADIVRWVNYVPIQAEEFGISSQNIDQIIAANRDNNPNNHSAPEIRRFLGLEGEIGAALGLPNNFALNIIKQIGNYSEIFERHFDDLERDRNFTWTDGGLLYSPPFSGKSIESNLIENDNRNLLKDVLERGYLKIGLPNNNPGFAIQKENDEFDGFEVDLGKAIAAALFGDANKLEITVQSFNDSFANTANGIVDVSAMSITHNIMRDASLGIDFSPTYLYTGQGILVRNDSAINNIPGLNGRKVGILKGSTALQNLEEALNEFGATIVPVEFATNDEMFAAYEKKEIDAVSTDQTILAARIPTFSNSNPKEHFILDEILSKEPLALITDENQSDWADVIRWVYNSLVLAEEYDITKDNIDELIARNTDNNSENDSTYAIRQLLGLEGNIGEALGLPNDFVIKAIKAVGNYGEIYERHFDSNILYRENNNLASNYGLQYALSNNTAVAPIIQNATFSVDENSEKETEVGIVNASDPEKEVLTFAIISGNIDPDKDNNLAFSLDPFTGRITVNDKDDLDFETTPNFNLEILATDADGLSDIANITVKLNDIPSSAFDTSENQNGIFTLNGEDPSNIKFTLVNNNTENVNEVGVFVVDDKNGTVDGKSPGSEGYLKAALQRAQIIFSAINNRPNGFDLEDIRKVIEVNSQASLGFYLVSNGTTDTALAQLQETGTTNLPIFFSDSSNLQVSDFSENGFNLNWSDQTGGSNFTSMELRVELTEDIPAPFTKLQRETRKELIDLTDVTGQVSVSVEVHREAAFDNLIGFYQVTDINGGIDTTGDGKADIFVGQEGYKQAALTNRITGLDLLKTDNQQTNTLDGNFNGGSILASFMVVDGTVDEAINNSAQTYFSFLGANSDGVDHIRLLGDNTFGYEDLTGGGDNDFNDMIVKLDFPTV